MRKSRTKTGFRLRAGIAVAATAAAVVAGTAVPAYAVGTFVVTPTQVGPGITNIYFYKASGTTALSTSTWVRFLPTATTCPTNYNSVDATAINGGQLTGGANLAWVVAPATLVVGSSYKTCLYADNAGGGAAGDTAASVGATTILAVNMGSLSATTGAANTRPTLTVPTANTFGTVATYTAQFVSGVSACPTTYTTADGTHINANATTRTSGTVLTITVPTLTPATPYLVCAYAGTSNGVSALTARASSTFSTYATTLPAVTISPTGGSSGVATNVLVTAPSAIFTGTPEALVSRNTCPSVRPLNADLILPAGLETTAASTTKITTSKLAVVMPTSTLVSPADVTTPWNICIYSSNSGGVGTLLASPAVYNVAPVLGVGSAQFAVGNSSPSGTASGPAQGGSTITISGLTGLPSQAAVTAGAVLSASLGGSPITITSNDTTSITGTTTSHAPGLVKLAVTTAAGTQTETTGHYTYTYGINVQPNTAVARAQPVLDITGAGFSSLTFDPAQTAPSTAPAGAPAANTSYVLLTDNTWYGQTFPASPAAGIASAWLNATKPIAFCNGVLPISDSEIICTLDLQGLITGIGSGPTYAPTVSGDVPTGTYTITVVNDADDINQGDYSIISSGSTFTVAPF